MAENFGSLVEIQNFVEALSGHIRQCKKRGIGKLASLIVKADGAALYHVSISLFSEDVYKRQEAVWTSGLRH